LNVEPLAPPEPLLLKVTEFGVLVDTEQLDPRVQVCPFTVVEAFARSAFVTKPVAVKDEVTVALETVGEFAKTIGPVPVGPFREMLNVPDVVTGLPVTVNCPAGIDRPTLVTVPEGDV
jgi:hypothetical protein